MIDNNDVEDSQEVSVENKDGSKVIILSLLAFFVVATFGVLTFFKSSNIGAVSGVNSGTMSDSSEDVAPDKVGSEQYEISRIIDADKKMDEAKKTGRSMLLLSGAGLNNVSDLSYTPPPSVIAPPPLTRTTSDPARQLARDILLEKVDRKEELMISLMNQWGNVPGGLTVEVFTGDPEPNEQQATTSASVSTINQSERVDTTPESPIRSGEILYARTMMASSSDLAGQAPEILVEIISPRRYRGARLIGSFSVLDNSVIDPRLVLRFKALRLDGQRYAINGLAVNPDDAEAAMADEVKSHAFKRGALLVSASLLKGAADLASAIVQNPKGETVTNGNATTSTSDGFDSDDQAIIAGGGIADSLSDELNNLRNKIPYNTIKVKEGKEIAIVIL